MTIFAADYTDRVLEGSSGMTFKIINTLLTVVPMIIITWVLGMLFKQTYGKYALSNIILGLGFVVIWGIVIWMLSRQFADDAPEVPASWFGILNSFFIIAFAPLFSKIWKSKYNPSGPVKFAIGLILLGLGFGILSFGSMGIPLGAKTASVSMVFLVLAYLFHTLGELCVSPVGLSYVSKLAPAKLVGLMFGIWFVANFIANTAAGITGSYIDPIVEEHGMATFFLIFTVIPAGAGVVMLLLNKTLIRMMHGIR
jgi:POT family proton-dependent oligopeptide transporter